MMARLNVKNRQNIAINRKELDGRTINVLPDAVCASFVDSKCNKALGKVYPL